MMDENNAPLNNGQHCPSQISPEEDRYSSPWMRSRKAGLRYRSVGSGYWVAFLLPIAIYLGDLGHQKQSKTAVMIILFNVFVLCGLRWMDVQFPMFLQRLRKTYVGLSMIFLLIYIGNGGRTYEVVSYVALNFTFPYAFYNLIRQHPKSFSFGEAVLVTSAFSYMFWGSSQSLPFPPLDFPIASSQDETVMVSLFLQLVFFGTILGARIVLLLQKPWKLFILEEMLCLWSKYCTIAFFTRVPVLNDEVAAFLLMWPFNFLFATKLRTRLITFWALITALTAVYLIRKNCSSDTTTTTINRKVFHAAIAFVFLPGIFWDLNLIYCCSAVVFFIFLLIETVRVLKLEVPRIKIGEKINLYVKEFRDSQDEGQLLLTPIYLLVGCALPIWLTGMKPSNVSMKEIEYAACLSGIVSIGVGDTFASIGGTYYGRTRWADSRKTVEGTMCSIMAQIIAVALIFLSDAMPYDSTSLTALIVACIINAVIEGNTDQIDNLVLPLVTFISVHIFAIVFS